MTVRRREEENASQAMDPLERRLTDALETPPQFTIAADFTARVISQMPIRKPVRYRIPARASIGRRVSIIAMAVLFVAMFAFAMQTGAANAAVRIAALWTFAAEFIILAVWVSLRPSQSL